MAGYCRLANLEQGRPTADAAVRRLTYEIHQCRALGATALKLIHGYGSSGTGGRIRIEVRGYLERQKSMGRIKDYIVGEKFSIFDTATLSAFGHCPDLRKDEDLERHNNGITIVLL